MRPLLAALASMLVLVQPARAQDRVALWTASAGDVGEIAVEVAQASRRALGAARAAAASASCDPTEPGCIAHLVRGTGASRLLAVRTVWVRGPCVPIVRDGVRVGSRMLRAPGVELTLYAADGSVLSERTLRDEDRDRLVAQVAPAIALLLGP